jgi:hypothetical protein
VVHKPKSSITFDDLKKKQKGRKMNAKQRGARREREKFRDCQDL